MGEKDKNNAVVVNSKISEIVKSPIQFAFMTFTVLSLAMLVPFMYASYQFLKISKANAPEGYEFPMFSDFRLTGCSAIVFAALQYVCRRVFYVMFYPFCKTCETEKEREMRSGKAAFNIFKIFYFTIATFWGFYVLLDQHFMPPSLGGNGVFKNAWLDYPYQEHPP